MVNQVGVVNIWIELCSDVMGGMGVVLGSYGSGVLINFVLLVKVKLDDDVMVILLFVGVQVMDEDNFQDEIDIINDKINYYKDVVDSLIFIEVIINLLGLIDQFQGVVKDFVDELDYFKGKIVCVMVGVGIVVSIFNDVFFVVFMVKGYVYGCVSFFIDQ